MAVLARPHFLGDPPRGPEPSEFRIFPSDPAIELDASAGITTTEKARLTMLYQEHGDRIHRFTRDLLRDAALAADATQETFVRAYRRLHELEARSTCHGDRDPLVPWLFGIARYVALEMRRARWRASRHVVADAPHEHVAASGSPETEVLGREALRVVESALDELPLERRAMLLLRLDHGLSYDDIAKVMECSLSKVKIEIFRAREALRATMASYEEGGRASDRRAR